MSEHANLLDGKTYLDIWVEGWPGYAKALSPEAKAALLRVIECAMHNAMANRFSIPEVNALVAVERAACARIADGEKELSDRAASVLTDLGAVQAACGGKACAHAIAAAIRARGSE